MKNFLNTVFVIIAAIAGYMLAVKNLSGDGTTDLASALENVTYVDLTHTMQEGMPAGPSGNEAPTIKNFRSHDDGTAAINRYNFPGQWGTHVDPPVHFVKGLRNLEDIPIEEMILPLIVVDVHEKVEINQDYQVSMDDINDWESRNGQIPEKSFVALHTDWSKRWPSPEKMRNRDVNGVSHSPGWSKEVIDYLVLTRNVTAIGHETLDTDPGISSGAGEWPLQTYYMGLNKYQIENMKSLDLLPEKGATIVATWALPKAGSGFPARVFAIVPQQK